MIRDGQKERELAAAIKDVEEAAYKMKGDMDDLNRQHRISSEDYRLFKGKFAEVLREIASGVDTSREAFEEKKKDLQTLYREIVANTSFVQESSLTEEEDHNEPQESGEQPAQTMTAWIMSQFGL